MTPTLHFDKIVTLAKPIYQAGQNLFFTLYGIKEVVWDGVRVKKQLENEQVNKIRSLWTKARDALAELGIIHGFYYAGMGIAAMCGYTKVSWLSFLMANVYMLKQSVEMLEQTKHMEAHPTVDKIRASAIMGILNSLGYCFTAAFALLSGSVALALVLGVISVTIGCIKILYDFFVLGPKLAE